MALADSSSTVNVAGSLKAKKDLSITSSDDLVIEAAATAATKESKAVQTSLLVAKLKHIRYNVQSSALLGNEKVPERSKSPRIKQVLLTPNPLSLSSKEVTAVWLSITRNSIPFECSVEYRIFKRGFRSFRYGKKCYGRFDDQSRKRGRGFRHVKTSL